MTDELRDVPGYSGLYSITRDARVWSHPKRPAPGKNGRVHDGKWMSPVLNRRTGHFSVVLSRDGIKKRVHTLALAKRVFSCA